MKNELKKLNIVRKRRANRGRVKFFGTKDIPRLSVSISNIFIYLQLIDDVNGVTIVSSHSKNVEGDKVVSEINDKKEDKSKKAVKKIHSKRVNKSSAKIAKIVAKDIAEKAKKVGIKKVVFDRRGRRFQGVVKTVADTVKDNGISI